MHTTGSRLRLRSAARLLRLSVGAAVALAVIAVLAGANGKITGTAHAGVVNKVTVNNTGNADDGVCGGPANDNTIGGDCTLIEAINDANNGLADVINFQPSVFTVGSRGFTNIASLAFGGGGCPTLAGQAMRTGSRAHAAHGGALRFGPAVSCAQKTQR